MEPLTAFVGCPTHNGSIDGATAQAMWAAASLKLRCLVVASTGSLLTMNCNGLWATALTERKRRNIGWFAMIHADVEPENYWVDKLVDLAERNKADVMSAIVPIKDGRGLTSTALSDPSDPWVSHCRLTLKQTNHPDFPETFDRDGVVAALEALPEPSRVTGIPDGAKLLVNTGCCVVRMGEWCENVSFGNCDTIKRMPGGGFRAYTQPEDWIFSLRCGDAGAKVMATRALRVVHRGAAQFMSDATWGQDRDVFCDRERELQQQT